MSDKYGIYLQRKEAVLVGTLWLNHTRGKLSSSFVYDEQWLLTPYCFALGPDLPLDMHPKSCEGLFLCFQDCSPDRWGRVMLLRQERVRAKNEMRKPHTLLDSDFLLRVNDFTRQGAIRISADNGNSFLQQYAKDTVPPLINLPRLLHASQNICTNKENESDLRLLVAPGSSLGGARPKASVLGTKNELYIAKFPGPNDVRDIPLWEYVTLRLAQKAGLKTPEFMLHKVAGRNVLLVRRFDREGEERIPFISAMSLLKLQDGDHASYADMAAIIQADGATPNEDLSELWSRMVFNMCVYNVDDHPRNHGFLRDRLGWRLSPVYDLETSHPEEKAPFLHTAIIDQSDMFNLDDTLEAAEFFRLKKNEAKERMAEIRKAVSCWKQEASLVNAKPEEIRVMQDAFEYL